jgi:hypothetical protein
VASLCVRPECSFVYTLSHAFGYPSLSCGHCFCESCLIDWFNVALTRHCAENPEYQPNAQVPAQYTLLARQGIQPLTRLHKPPMYTCPSCRVPITARPGEVFILKAAVRALSGPSGENSPKRNRRRLADPFSKFFRQYDAFFT